MEGLDKVIFSDDGKMVENPGGRVGVLGGTFNPVHNGHLRLAEQVRRALALNAVLFIPAARPPHKGEEEVASFEHRIAMVKIAVRGHRRFLVSGMEGGREGPSYSVDTLKELRTRLAADTRFFFIVGMDAFVEMDTWKNWRQLLDITNLAVAPRPGSPLTMIAGTVRQMGRFSFDAAASCWTAPDRTGRIYPVAMEPLAISSTDIRQKIGAGISPVGLLPEPVADYIDRLRLYGSG